MITQNRPQRSPLSSETINNLNTNYYKEKYFITIFSYRVINISDSPVGNNP